MNIIEKQWTTNEGFTAVVVFHNTLFHRCGYIGMPIEISNKYSYFMDMDLDVHGGITYESPEQGYPIETDEPFYWIGFDCGHSSDAKDFEAANAYMEAGMDIKREDYDANVRYAYPSGTVKTFDYVVSECNSLSEQIANLHDNTYPEDENCNRKKIGLLENINEIVDCMDECSVTTSELIAEIIRRRDIASTKTTSSFNTYADGYYAALGELLEWID